jgi:hypothetical protein
VAHIIPFDDFAKMLHKDPAIKKHREQVYRVIRNNIAIKHKVVGIREPFINIDTWNKVLKQA